MTPRQRDELGDQMRKRAREILAQGRQQLADAGGPPEARTDVEDSMDAALDDELKTTRIDLSERDRGLLRQLGDALDRMRDGSYGKCIDCGRVIELERLRAVPWAARCAEDQEQWEAEHRVDTPSL